MTLETETIEAYDLLKLFPKLKKKVDFDKLKQYATDIFIDYLTDDPAIKVNASNTLLIERNNTILYYRDELEKLCTKTHPLLTRVYSGETTFEKSIAPFRYAFVQTLAMSTSWDTNDRIKLLKETNKEYIPDYNAVAKLFGIDTIEYNDYLFCHRWLSGRSVALMAIYSCILTGVNPSHPNFEGPIIFSIFTELTALLMGDGRIVNNNGGIKDPHVVRHAREVDKRINILRRDY